MRVVALEEDLVGPVARLAGAGLRRMADRSAGIGVRRPAEPAADMAERMLRGHLGAADRLCLAVLDDSGQPCAFASANLLDLVPDNYFYTYLPPRLVLLAATAWCAGSGDQVAALRDAIRAAVSPSGYPWLLVHTPPGDAEAVSWWRDVGLWAQAARASRPVSTWSAAGSAAGVTVRVAGPDDVAAVADLALEQYLFHAMHCTPGPSRDQSLEAIRREAAEAVAATAGDGDGTTHQLVAERDGTVVGAVVGTINEWDDGNLLRYQLPPRYGYIGNTTVAAAARGAGVGRALVDALMRWFAVRRVDRVFLHYQAANPVSGPFWTRLGFGACQQIQAAAL